MVLAKSQSFDHSNRTVRAKRNILSSLCLQLVMVVCGLIVPRMLLGAFGSDAYGATASIAQFLSYITLLEGGVGGVARAALYKPLADRNWEQVSLILYEIKRFFRIVGAIFIFYILCIACSFKYIAHFAYYDWLSTFFLVIAISFSMLAQYFLGISYYILLQVAQRGYVDQLISMGGIILNTLCVVLLVQCHSGLITVKFVSAFVFLLQPLALYYYVRTHFPLVPVTQRNPQVLAQKWNGLGQHLAYFLHNNTDIVVLTLFTNLSWVAVYAVYNMIVVQMQNFTLSFSQGMEALFGELLAKRETENLHKTFNYYETLISLVSIPLLGTTAVLLVPFIGLYTHGITDAVYYQPQFAFLLVLAALMHCLRIPYHNLTIAAGHFKQTQGAAFAEALLNICISILLVLHFGLIGVTIGTLVAILFRFLYYIFYLTYHIFHRAIYQALQRTCLNTGLFIGICWAGHVILQHYPLDTYVRWVIAGAGVFVFACTATLAINYLFYPGLVKGLVRKSFHG